MMATRLDHRLAERFRLSHVPTLEARVLPSVAPLAFTRMRHVNPQRGRSISPEPEEAFSFQLPLVSSGLSDLRYDDGPQVSQEVKEPGRAFLFDLSARPSVGLESTFDNVRMYIAQSTIEALAYEGGLRPVGGLRQVSLGAPDPTLFHLACALLPALEDPDGATPAFVEHIALAFHAHVIRAYGGATTSEKRRAGSLAAWQMRRVQDIVSANLAANPSIGDLANACGLSTSYFNEAFKTTTGMPPHRWILERRVTRAKTLLTGTDLNLATVAIQCGFYDQGHMSRVFKRFEGRTPLVWRRSSRSG